mgnify:CR=1 FL=1
MDAFFVSTFFVASAEIADKTQLLALLLATRFHRPVPIIWGILVATLINHTIAGALGEWIGSHLMGTTLHWILAVSFMSAAVWMLIPDKLNSDAQENRHQSSIFVATVIAFFLAEIGDKTQVATVLLAAQFQTLIPVVLGTTIGMLIANIPIVLLGNRGKKFISMNVIRVVSASIFLLLGISELVKLK